MLELNVVAKPKPIPVHEAKPTGGLTIKLSGTYKSVANRTTKELEPGPLPDTIMGKFTDQTVTARWVWTVHGKYLGRVYPNKPMLPGADHKRDLVVEVLNDQDSLLDQWEKGLITLEFTKPLYADVWYPIPPCGTKIYGGDVMDITKLKNIKNATFRKKQ